MVRYFTTSGYANVDTPPMPSEPPDPQDLVPLTDEQKLSLMSGMAISRAALWALHQAGMIRDPEPGNDQEQHAYELYQEAVGPGN